jgi:hypothetical protein
MKADRDSNLWPWQLLDCTLTAPLTRWWYVGTWAHHTGILKKRDLRYIFHVRFKYSTHTLEQSHLTQPQVSLLLSLFKDACRYTGYTQSNTAKVRMKIRQWKDLEESYIDQFQGPGFPYQRNNYKKLWKFINLEMHKKNTDIRASDLLRWQGDRHNDEGSKHLWNVGRLLPNVTT